LPKMKVPIHNLSTNIINPLTGEELFVSGDYWNGKIDVRNRFGKDRVMSLTEQKRWLNAPEYKAVNGLVWWLKTSEALWKVLEDNNAPDPLPGYAVSVVCTHPENAAA